MHPSFTLPALLFMSVCALWPVKTGANTPLDAVVPPNAPRSEFKNDIGFGKDPFFPRSTRRPKVVVQPRNEPITASVPGHVALKGISVIKDKKLAIINDRTLAEGEEFTLKGNGQPDVKVKCVEIKEKSVIVGVGSATKELTLPTGY